MNIQERVKGIAATGFVVAGLAFGLFVLATPASAAEALVPVQNFHNSCNTDAE